MCAGAGRRGGFAGVHPFVGPLAALVGTVAIAAVTGFDSLLTPTQN